MAQICFYCSAPAIHQFKNQRHPDGRITQPGVWCCSKFISQCPANRAKNKASNKNRSSEWLERKQETCRIKYGVDHPMKLNENKKFGSNNTFADPTFKQSMLYRYGVTNASQLEGVGVKISETLSSKTKDWWIARSHKQRLAAEQSGAWTPLSEKWDYRTYRVQAAYQTEKNYQEFVNLINPENLIRSRSDFHVDHIYSIRDAFLNDVPISIVSHPCNLRMLSERENKRKNGKSDISLEELYRRFDESK